jgi:aminopeptidase N
MSMVIGDLKRFVEDDETAEKQLKRLTARLAAHQYARLGFEQIKNESDEDTKLRALMTSLMAYAEDDVVIGLGLNAFRSTHNLLELPSETRSVVLGIAGRHGTDKDFDRLLDLHGATPNAELREDIVSGLCMTRDSAHIDRLLARLTDNFKVKQQDIFRWFIYLLRNRHARDATWQWMVNNWDWIERTFAGDKSYDDFARYSASILSTRQWLDTYKAFFEPMRSITALARAIDVGTTEIMTRVEWLERDSADVKAALAQERQ